MSSELSILAIYGILILLVILFQVIIAIPALGLPYLASPRDEQRELPTYTGRAKRTIDNCAIAMATFGAAILILAAKDAFTSTTLLLAQVFLIARVIYVVVYILGIPWVRTLAFVAAMLCNLALLWLAV